MSGERLKDPSRFFEKAGPFKIEEIARLCGAELDDSSPHSSLFHGVAPLESAGADDVTFFTNRKFKTMLQTSSAGACILSAQDAKSAPEGMARLISGNPHHSYARLCAAFYPDASRPSPMGVKSGVSPEAYIDETASLEDSVTVEPGAFVGGGARIGKHTLLAAGAVVGHGVSIGRDGYVGPHASVSHAILGDRVFIHAGARIGQDGFGYAAHAKGIFKVPQTGRVIIQNDVEIGANSTIDRGSSKDTTIGEGTKIDNLVQIGHNCQIGRFCLIVSHTGLSGSVELDDNVVLGGQAGVADHVKIGFGAQVGGQSGVSKDIPAGGQYNGTPARPIKEAYREKALIMRLARQDMKQRRGKGQR